MSAVTDVIAAVSTPPGKGGVAVIRISGLGAFDIADEIFKPKGKNAPPRYQAYGYVIDDGEILDDVLLTRFPSPNSYTGEDVVEISCHGSILLTKTILELLIRKGARPAEAGEFTRRAFINGRLSLSETEAIGNLLEAESREQIRLASTPARKKLRKRLDDIRNALVDIMSSVYARIDYPDEDLGELDDGEIIRRLYIIKEDLEKLISTYRTGKAIQEGVKTVICGKPNAGKSSLYNLLLGEDAAIVTEIEGTTRDVLEKSVPLGKVLLRLADTAGIRSSEFLDKVEAIGIEKSYQKIAESELLFAIFDLSRDFEEYDEEIISAISKSAAAKIAIFNKSDLPLKFDKDRLPDIFDEQITVSVKEGDALAISALEKCVEKLFTDERIVIGEDAVISSQRQHASLLAALDFINNALAGLKCGFSQDAASSDIERAVGAVSLLDGRAVSEEVVADIFSKFCVGK